MGRQTKKQCPGLSKGLSLLDVFMKEAATVLDVLCILGNSTDVINFSRTCKFLDDFVRSPSQDTILWQLVAKKTSRFFPDDYDDILHVSNTWKYQCMKTKIWDSAFLKIDESVKIPQYHKPSIEKMPEISSDKEVSWVMASNGVYPGFSSINLSDSVLYGDDGEIHAFMFSGDLRHDRIATYAVSKDDCGQNWNVLRFQCSEMEKPFDMNSKRTPGYHVCVFHKETGTPVRNFRRLGPNDCVFQVHRFEWDGSETSWDLGCDKPHWYVGSKDLLVYSVLNTEPSRVPSIVKCVKHGNMPDNLLWSFELSVLHIIDFGTNACVLALMVCKHVSLMKECCIEIRNIENGNLENTLMIPVDGNDISNYDSTSLSPLKLTDTHLVCAVHSDIYVWNLEKTEHLYKLPFPAMNSVDDSNQMYISSISIIDDGCHLAASTSEGKLIIWDIRKKKIQFYCETNYPDIIKGNCESNMGAGFWLWYQIKPKYQRSKCLACNVEVPSHFEECYCGEQLNSPPQGQAQDRVEGNDSDNTVVNQASLGGTEALVVKGAEDHATVQGGNRHLSSATVTEELDVNIKSGKSSTSEVVHQDQESESSPNLKNPEPAVKNTKTKATGDSNLNENVECSKISVYKAVESQDVESSLEANKSETNMTNSQVTLQTNIKENINTARSFDFEKNRGVIWVELMPPCEDFQRNLNILMDILRRRQQRGERFPRQMDILRIMNMIYD